MRTPEKIYKEWKAATELAEDIDHEFIYWFRYASALQWALGDDFERLDTPPWVPPTDKLEQLAEWVRIGQTIGSPKDQFKWWDSHPLQETRHEGVFGIEGFDLVRVLEWLKG